MSNHNKICVNQVFNSQGVNCHGMKNPNESSNEFCVYISGTHVDITLLINASILFFLLYFEFDILHTNCNLATLGTVYNHWVIQVNRLSQVLAHRDKLRGFRRETPVIVLKIAL